MQIKKLEICLSSRFFKGIFGIVCETLANSEKQRAVLGDNSSRLVPSLQTSLNSSDQSLVHVTRFF